MEETIKMYKAEVNNKMQILELFCGTKSFSKVALRRGHTTQTIDNDKIHQPDWCIDIQDISIDDIYIRPDIIWASPPCTCFSVASIGKHWTGGKKAYIPKTTQAEDAIKIIEKTKEIIEALAPRFWFIENPRGVLRKLPVLKGYKRSTVTYCQYGDKRMKPTDIWTNCNMTFKPPCKNGSPCHAAAPRGSRTGTQGLKGPIERGKVPETLCEDILKYCEAFL